MPTPKNPEKTTIEVTRPQYPATADDTTPTVEEIVNQPSTDNVAMVSRLNDLSDAQPNATVRILDDKESNKADKVQRLETP